MFIPEELYRRIIQVIPIPCVDLLVADAQGRVLMVKRKNPPAQGQWWFPGGRVHIGESRKEAARRKLSEECGLQADTLRELGTYDLIISDSFGNVSHGITTVYKAAVDGTGVRLDGQSSEFSWLHPGEWMQEPLHEFPRNIILSLMNERPAPSCLAG